jgi:hypothetical protein
MRTLTSRAEGFKVCVKGGGFGLLGVLLGPEALAVTEPLGCGGGAIEAATEAGIILHMWWGPYFVITTATNLRLYVNAEIEEAKACN